MLCFQEGTDLVAQAKTGSGKTFAYLLPLLQKLLRLSSEGSVRKSAPNALILVPTRELCQQVYLTSILSQNTSRVAIYICVHMLIHAR
jgi:ATP-dependent RNA helicase DDX56/DBP9